MKCLLSLAFLASLTVVLFAEGDNLVPVEAVEEEAGGAAEAGSTKGNYMRDYYAARAARRYAYAMAAARGKGYNPVLMAAARSKGYVQPPAFSKGYVQPPASSKGYATLMAAARRRSYLLAAAASSKGYTPLMAAPRSKAYTPLMAATASKGYTPLMAAAASKGYTPPMAAARSKGYTPLMAAARSKGYTPLMAAGKGYPYLSNYMSAGKGYPYQYDSAMLLEKRSECAAELGKYYYNTEKMKVELYSESQEGQVQYMSDMRKCLAEKMAEVAEEEEEDLQSEAGAESGDGDNEESEEEETNPTVPMPGFGSTPQRCYQSSDTGLCRANLKRYFFNTVSGKCEEFTYGGCYGNTNNFETLEKCQASCSCGLPADRGHCYAYLPRYFFNSATNRCQQFIYGGCGGNVNNFRTEKECAAQCACRLPSDKGSCFGYQVRYYMSQTSQRCERFVYGGCAGNSNNFQTKSDCESTC